MPRRHVVLTFVVAVCWAVNFVVIDIRLESFPPFLFAALCFALIALPAIFLVPRPNVRWRAVVAGGLFIGVGQFGLPIYEAFAEPSDGLEPSTPSPSSNEEGSAGKAGKPRARKPRKTQESPEDE